MSRRMSRKDLEYIFDSDLFVSVSGRAGVR